jgi:hypothetical protein
MNEYGPPVWNIEGTALGEKFKEHLAKTKFAILASRCRCDCASCAENEHLGCYYRQNGVTECPVLAAVEKFGNGLIE